MIRIKNIKLDVKKNNLEEKIIKKLGTNIINYKINKRSIDARNKNQIFYVYEVDIQVDNENKFINNKDIIKTPNEEYKFIVSGKEKLNSKPIVVGAGPAGLFAAYFLAENNYKPIIIERGKKVEDRIEDVEKFWKSGVLNKNSNVVFGEGGAGTFSDGKLNTLKKDKLFRQKKVFEIFVENGAPEEILYDAMPHIGTDKLINVIKSIRNKIISMGGEFRFNTTLTDIIINDNKVTSIEVNNNEVIDTDILILGLGHSARDTFKMLYDKNINITSKPFAVGVRVEHKKDMIDTNQYGKYKDLLPSAYYKLTHKAKNGRGVYTFCMCPGGYVVNSSNEDNSLVINGMSNYKRDSSNSNSAVIVTVNEKDYGSNPLDGMKYQERLEQAAYKEGKGAIPVQLYKDLKDNVVSTSFKNVKPIFKSNYTLANINNILDKDIIDSIIEAIDSFNKKIDGFSSDDTIISAVESRTSSPIRIIRDDNYEASIKGIYPIGEGAGYAGGITSSAIDGVKVSELIATKYHSM